MGGAWGSRRGSKLASQVHLRGGRRDSGRQSAPPESEGMHAIAEGPTLSCRGHGRAWRPYQPIRSLKITGRLVTGHLVTEPSLWLRLQAQRVRRVAIGQEARSSSAAQPNSSDLDPVRQTPPVQRTSGDLARMNFSRRFSHSSELKNLGPTSIRRGIMLNTAIRLHGRPSRMRNPFSFRSLTIAE